MTKEKKLLQTHFILEQVTAMNHCILNNCVGIINAGRGISVSPKW